MTTSGEVSGASGVDDMSRHSTILIKIEVVELGQPRGSEIDLDCDIKTKTATTMTSAK
jgi:hypothetical protein